MEITAVRNNDDAIPTMGCNRESNCRLKQSMTDTAIANHKAKALAERNWEKLSRLPSLGHKATTITTISAMPNMAMIRVRRQKSGSQGTIASDIICPFTAIQIKAVWPNTPSATAFDCLVSHQSRQGPGTLKSPQNSGKHAVTRAVFPSNLHPPLFDERTQ